MGLTAGAGASEIWVVGVASMMLSVMTDALNIFRIARAMPSRSSSRVVEPTASGTIDSGSGSGSGITILHAEKPLSGLNVKVQTLVPVCVHQ